MFAFQSHTWLSGLPIRAPTFRRDDCETDKLGESKFGAVPAYSLQGPIFGNLSQPSEPGFSGGLRKRRNQRRDWPRFIPSW